MDKHAFTRRGFTLAARAGNLAQRVQNDDHARVIVGGLRQFVLAFVLSRGTMFEIGRASCRERG